MAMEYYRKKVLAKYDSGAEYEVREWIKQLVGEDIGSGAMEVEKKLRNGQILCKLAQAVYAGTPNLPPAAKNYKIKVNSMAAPFKQMENIEVFLKACELYGVPSNSLFPTADLFDGRNMAMVISTVLQLGSEAQRHGFQGPTCGSKPSEKHIVNFTEDQLRAGQGIIGLQAGTNKCASQAGMKMGASRHIADIRSDDMCKDGMGIIGLQAGSNKGASQAGMSMGSVRHIADIRADDMSQEGQGVIGLQSGSNKGASQAGMSMGSVRHIADIRADDMSKEGQGMIGLQAGSNKGASQAGMSMGSVRHIADIRADDASRESSGMIGLQMGSNRGASQTGMSMGGQRHISDIKVDDMSQAGKASINLQYGSNQGANQQGMSYGGRRDIKGN
ncbi:calponin-1-like isoform X3 [Littorina saxatilis]|uniref:calponin-1-like isoform X3 n=1 Tax=Littorina saxatilis TaxID=31220 RepID=UPI0038B62530